MISIEDFDSHLMKMGRKLYKNISIYYVGYITIKKLMIMEIFIVYLIIGKVIGHIEEKMEVNV